MITEVSRLKGTGPVPIRMEVCAVNGGFACALYAPEPHGLLRANTIKGDEKYARVEAIDWLEQQGVEVQSLTLVRNEYFRQPKD